VIELHITLLLSLTTQTPTGAFVFASAPALSSLTTLELSGCHFLSNLALRAIVRAS
jgi:hypothetical protein